MIKPVNYKAVILVVIAISAVMVISMITYHYGFLAGKEAETKAIFSETNMHYTPAINTLKSELYTIENKNEEAVAALVKKHNEKLAGIKKNHNNTIEKMNAQSSSDINLMNREHQTEMVLMENLHKANIEKTQKDSYAIGLKVMTERIGGIYNLDVKNMPLPDKWDTVVNSIR